VIGDLGVARGGHGGGEEGPRVLAELAEIQPFRAACAD